MLSTVFEHDRVVSSTQKNFRARDAVEFSDVSVSAGNNPGVLKHSTEHAEPFFIAFRQFQQMTSISLRISRRQCTIVRFKNLWTNFSNCCGLINIGQDLFIFVSLESV